MNNVHLTTWTTISFHITIIQIISALAPVLGPERCTERCLPIVERLAGDVIFYVRKEAATAVGSLAVSVPQDVVVTRLVSFDGKNGDHGGSVVLKVINSHTTSSTASFVHDLHKGWHLARSTLMRPGPTTAMRCPTRRLARAHSYPKR